MRQFKAQSIKSVLNRQRVIALSAALIFLVAALLWTSHDNNSQKLRVSADPSAPAVDTCQQANTITFSCYKTELKAIIQQSGAEPASALVKQQYTKVPYVKSQCHQLMHVIGRAALAKYGNIADTYAHGDQFCWSGYYHGALEQLASEKGVDFLIKNANQVCAAVPGKSTHSFYYYNCVHGLGHGYMFVENGNLFKSLSNCDSLVEDFDRTSCYGGVFMQNIMNEQAPDEEEDTAGQPQQITLKQDEPMYPCTAVDTKYRQQCYLMQTSYALQVENYDFGKVFALCDGVEPTYRDTCYTSLGRDASGNSISDVTRTRESCLLGKTPEAQKFCIRGAAYDFVSYFHSDKQAYQLCASLPASMQSDCSSAVKSYYSSF